MSEATLATYRSAEGVARFLAKEAPREARRAETVHASLEDLDLAGARVLDAGCGYGRDVAAMAARGADAHGTDASEAMVALARRRHPRLAGRFAVARLEAGQPFADGSFDLVWCRASLLHVAREAMPATVADLARLVAPGGRLVVLTKVGEGERVDVSLGADLPRAMVLHAPDAIEAALRGTGLAREGPIETGFVAASGDLCKTQKVDGTSPQEVTGLGLARGRVLQ